MLYDFYNDLETNGNKSIYTVLERGDLYVDNDGKGTYYDAGNRVRTIANHPLKLYRDDKIITDDPANSVFIVYKKMVIHTPMFILLVLMILL